VIERVATRILITSENSATEVYIFCKKRMNQKGDVKQGALLRTHKY